MKKISYILIVLIMFVCSLNINAQTTKKVITHVTVTTYHPVAKECNNDPLHTADMSKIDLHKLKKGEIRWCAISRDLLWLFPMGSKIHLEGFGWFEVHDLMNKRFNHCVDILIHPSDNKLVKKQNVKMVKR